MTNRYGNPVQARFFNNGYLAVDRNTRNGKFVSKSWFKRLVKSIQNRYLIINYVLNMQHTIKLLKNLKKNLTIILNIGINIMANILRMILIIVRKYNENK
mgnify:CR=1 FL=1